MVDEYQEIWRKGGFKGLYTKEDALNIYRYQIQSGLKWLIFQSIDNVVFLTIFSLFSAFKFDKNCQSKKKLALIFNNNFLFLDI